jgi:hypothetical protein
MAAIGQQKILWRIDTAEGRPKLASLSYNESSTHSFDEGSTNMNARKP